MDLVVIHRAMLGISREKLCPIYFFSYGESKDHKMILCQVRSRNLKASVTFFAAFQVSFVHEEIRWGLWEEGEGEQLDQRWEPTGGHQHGPQRLAAQQLPGGENVGYTKSSLHWLPGDKGMGAKAEGEANIEGIQK